MQHVRETPSSVFGSHIRLDSSCLTGDRKPVGVLHQMTSPARVLSMLLRQLLFWSAHRGVGTETKEDEIMEDFSSSSDEAPQTPVKICTEPVKKEETMSSCAGCDDNCWCKQTEWQGVEEHE